ncbi:MAG: hypothetical protein LKF31_08275 [Muribaculaceae bacterium]|jgi:hypothetical protein|nr:hypothetical protein [Muribaculaceae bacterium]
MANKYVFSLVTGESAKPDWFDDGNNRYSNKEDIAKIQDANGESKDFEITSIPSPFARMDLVKEAFGKVAGKDGDLDNNNSIYNKLVSDALDIGEIFFNIERFKGRISIIRCSIKEGAEDGESIKYLTNSNQPGHKLLGKTLKLFLKQDAATNHFDKMDNVFLLKYIGDGAEADTILGGTSPTSLFFTSANDYSRLRENLALSDGDKALDSYLRPLYKRDFEYVKFLYSMKQFYPDFAKDFKEVDDYLTKTQEKLANSTNNVEKEHGNILLKITNKTDNKEDKSNTDFENYYSKLPDIKSNAVDVNILNDFPLKRRKDISPSEVSEFRIKPNKDVYKGKDEELPLVLPVIKGDGKDRLYVSGKWDPTFVAPTRCDEASLNERILPQDNTKGPWLTLADFFEDNIIFNVLPNTNGFYQFKGASYNNGSYLLPIKKIFFKYFNTDDLVDETKCDLKFDCEENSVTVTLKIPIKGSKSERNSVITYKKIYITNDNTNKDPDVGYIETKTFNFSIFPFLRFPDDVFAKYRLTFYGKDENEFNLYCYKYGGHKVECLDSEKRNRGDKDMKIENIELSPITFSIEQTKISEDSNFDFIECVFPDNYKCILIPTFGQTATGSDNYYFAVDFGTCNTHIEYKKSRTDGTNSGAMPFEIDEKMPQFEIMDRINPDSEMVFHSDMIPLAIGKKENEMTIHFPIRTALSAKRNIKWGDINPQHILFLKANIPFYYEKETNLAYNEIFTNLKWATDKSTGADPKVIPNKVETYFSSLMMLMRNKVLLDGGKLQNTRLIWTYPTSMPLGLRDQIAEAWEKTYKAHIKPEFSNEIKRLPESVAPFYYAYGSGGKGDIVCIDIGGGTSDLYFVQSQSNIKYVTSLKFAANDIYSDGYVTINALRSNAFVNFFMKTYETKLDSDSKKVLDQIKRGTSADVISFLFSLKDNPKIDAEKRFDFSEDLKLSKPACFLVLLFYSALIYQIAVITKVKNLKCPRTISFTGNGSRMLQIIANGKRIDRLTEYTKKFFMKFFNVDKYEQDDGLSIKLETEIPKEATCKGALEAFDEADKIEKELDDSKLIWIGTGREQTDFATKDFTYDKIGATEYSKVKAEVENFTELFYAVVKDMDMLDGLSLIDKSDFTRIKDLFSRDVASNITKVIKLLMPKDIDRKNTDVSEPLFYYHISCVMHDIADALFNNKTN